MATNETGSVTGATQTGASTGTAPTTVPAAPAGTRTTDNAPAVPNEGPVASVGTEGKTLDDLEFKKDGDLRVATKRELVDNVSGNPAAGGEVSYNEITGESTVVTTVDGKAVTFTLEGDHRPKGEHGRETVDEAMGRAFDADYNAERRSV